MSWASFLIPFPVAERPPEQARLHSLQALRGVAALLVMLYHTGTLYAVHTGEVLWQNVFRAGFAGVDVFFVLSGVVICSAHAGDIGRPERALRFAIRRAFRLLPVYWLVVAMKVLKDGASVPLATLVGAILLLPVPKPYITVAWTLSYEILFYTLFLVCILLPWGRYAALPLLALVVLPLLPLTGPADSPALQQAARFLSSAHWLEFAFGVVAYGLLRRCGPPSPAVSALLAAAGIGAFGVAAVLGTCISQSLIGQAGLSAHDVAELQGNAVLEHAVFSFGLPAAVAIVGLLGLERHGRLWLPWQRGLVWSGDVSYSLYLTHGFVINTLLGVGWARDWLVRQPLLLVVVWGAALLLASLLHRLVEIPALRLGGKLSGRRR
ncbi:MAG: acyltransferase [Accumulibacter sp.]|jgi:exopolysaccharide production protein ExoZ|uniref:acyltransferase family protein n=1 Tax=Accumulibacter sp. TaxID=2053492 RepID=UPI002FC34B77